MSARCTVPRVEATEIVSLTKTIDGAIVSILASVDGYDVAEALVRDLAEIASATQYIRGVTEQALDLDEAMSKPITPEVLADVARGLGVEPPSTANRTAGDDDEPSAGDVREAVSS